MGEYVLSEVIVRNNRVLLTIKDVGSWQIARQHKFPTKIISAQTREELKQKFAEYSPKEFSRIPQFNILQITAPINLEELLDEERRALFKKYFVTGHYTQTSRWEYGTPWRVITPDERLTKLLKEKKAVDATLEKNIEMAVNTLKNSEFAKKRRVKNFEDYVANNWQKIELPEIQKLREETEKGRMSLELRTRELFGAGEVETNTHDKKYDVILDRPYFEQLRGIKAEEILSGRMYVFDIEKPLFDTPEEEVSWLSSIITENGKPVKKTIKTLRDTGLESIGDWKIEKYETEEELVEAARKEIVTPENGKTIDTICAYNAPYDLENTEEAGDFTIGERESDPKVEVALDFFRKLKVHGRFVLDPLRPARIRYKHLPNRKFALVLAEAQGISKAKIIDNYDQLKELERTAITNDPGKLSKTTIALILKETGITEEEFLKNPGQICAQINARYVAGDVDNLYKMVHSEWFGKTLEDATWMSDTYGVELSRLLHSTNTIKDAQDRLFYQLVGTYRDEIYLKIKKMMALQQKAQGHLSERIAKRLLSQVNLNGPHAPVYKIRLPIGDWVKKYVAGIKEERFPAMLKLTQYAEQFRNDKLRMMNLQNYIDALASYLLTDYAIYNMANHEYNNFLSANGIDKKEFETSGQINSELTKLLHAHAIAPMEFNKFKNDYRKILRSEGSKYGPMHLDKGTLTKKGIEKHPRLAEEFCGRHKLNYEQLAEMLKLAVQKKETGLGDEQWQKLLELHAQVKKKERKFYGHYAIHPSEISRTLEQKISEVNKFLKGNGFWTIHEQAGYYYLAYGNKKALEAPDAPVILVDELEKAYLTQNPSYNVDFEERKNKIYYKKHGTYEGIKTTDRPSHLLTMHEMKTYGAIIELVLEGDYIGALEQANEALEELREVIKEKQEDVEGLAKLLDTKTVDTSSYEPYLTMPKINFVWLSKRTNTYRVFEHGELIYFVTDKTHARGEVKEDGSRKYFEEQGKGKPRKIYIAEMKDIQPDIKMYYRRVQERIRCLIEPLVGICSVEFVSKPVKDAGKYLKTTPLLF